MKISKRKEYSLLILAIIFIMGVLIYYGSIKEGFHMDELYSYGLSNSNYSPFPFANNKWLSGDYYQNYLTTDLETNFDYGSVIYNQTKDVHPPVYYILLHTISSLFPKIFSKWIGLGLNIIFSTLILFLVYEIIKYFTENRYASLIGVLFYGLSMGAISNYLFIRMYVVQTFFQVLLVYFTIKYIEKDAYNWKIILGLFITTILGGLTQYYYYIFAFLVTTILITIFLITKDFKKIVIYGLQSAASVITAFLLFPSVIDHVTSTNRGTEVLENAENNFSINKLETFINYISRDLFNDKLFIITMFIIISLIFSAILIFVRKNKQKDQIEKNLNINNNKKRSILMILFSVIIYIIVVSQVSHYQVPRYIYPVYPLIIILSMVLILWVSTFILQSKKMSAVLLIILTSIITVSSHYNNDPEYLFDGMRKNHQIINNIKDNNALVLSDSTWRISSQINELRELNNVYPGTISEDYELPMDEYFEESDTLVIFIYDKLDSEELHMEINSTYSLQNNIYLYSVSGFNVYLFSNNNL